MAPNTNRLPPPLAGALAVAGALLLAACRQVTPGDPLVVLADRTSDSPTWHRAAEHALGQFGAEPDHLDVLAQVILDPHQPAQRRRYAVSTMARLDPPRFLQFVKGHIVAIRDRYTLCLVIDEIVRRNWRDLSADILRSYARESASIADAERPERPALEALNPGMTVGDVAAGVFADERGSFDSQHHSAALHVLGREWGRERVIARYITTDHPPGHRLARDMRRCHEAFAAVPLTREEVIWMKFLLTGLEPQLAEAARLLVSELDESQRRGLELRHPPVLVAADPSWRRANRATLTRQILARIDVTSQVHRPLAAGAEPPSLEHQLAQCSWPDLLTLRVLVDALARPEIRRQIFQQAHADLADAESEHGGLLRAERRDGDVAITPVAYPPHEKVANTAYLPSPAMIIDLYSAVAYYHFHARDLDSSERFAGPGRGDLAQARSQRAGFLVFTLLSPRALNADFYQGDGLVIDLGTLKPPTGGSRETRE